MDWSEFFYMGGYAFEVWTSWGLTLLALVAFVIFPKRRNAKIKAEIKRQISREQRDDGKHNSKA
ncbi:MAG: heme exporter protein D [Arenicella sp.]|jgi:heme exporter protein D